jgi:multiple sugar transport system substrate-binding protein
LPIGLGAKGGEFNKVMQDTFQRILVKNEEIQKVLNEQAAILQTVMNDTKAPCWRPDPASTGPCQVK